MIRALSRGAGALRPVIVPLGLAALVMVGLHRGADRVDDVLLAWLDALDALADAGWAFLVSAVVGGLGGAAATVDGVTLWGAGLVSMEAREQAARAGALVAELAADALLVIPLLGYREREAGQPLRKPLLPGAARPPEPPLWELARALARMVMDPTILKVALPLATLLAAVAGVAAIALAVDAESAQLAVRGGGAGELAGRALALLGGAVVAVAFAWRAPMRALEHADALARKDRLERRPAVRRRMRGLASAALALPMALAGAAAVTPLGDVLAGAAEATGYGLQASGEAPTPPTAGATATPGEAATGYGLQASGEAPAPPTAGATPTPGEAVAGHELHAPGEPVPRPEAWSLKPEASPPPVLPREGPR